MHKIFHFTDEALWNSDSLEDYSHPSLETEDFIHCSFHHQLEATLLKHFKGTGQVIIVEIDKNKLTSELKIENQFPHLYGKLNRDSVMNIHMVNFDGKKWDLSKIQP